MDQVTCPGCGAEVELVGVFDPDDLDRIHCEDCNDRFYAAQAARFPLGQCPQCGGEGFVYTCENGAEHQTMHHVEGACSQWTDLAAEFEYGCSRCPQPVAIATSEEELPF